jgi:hypothetical protein
MTKEMKAPENFCLQHITSNPVTEPEIQIRYHDGNIEQISKEEAYFRIMKQNCDYIMKISWYNGNRLMRCGIMKGMYIAPEIANQFNLIINAEEHYCVITNFSFNPYTMAKKDGLVYYNTSPDYAIEVWNIYKIVQNKATNVIEI